MKTFDKVMSIMRDTIISIILIIMNSVGTLYFVDEVIYEEWFGAILVGGWILFSAYRITRWLIRDINEVIKK